MADHTEFTLAANHLQQDTDPRRKLDLALRRIRAVQQNLAAAHEESDFRLAARLAEEELDLLAGLVDIAEAVNNGL